jgi:hypothetical protein
MDREYPWSVATAGGFASRCDREWQPRRAQTRHCVAGFRRVGTPDMDSFETFVTARLGAVTGIGKIDSHLTMKVVKSPNHRPPASTRRRR